MHLIAVAFRSLFEAVRIKTRHEPDVGLVHQIGDPLVALVAAEQVLGEKDDLQEKKSSKLKHFSQFQFT